MTRKTLSTLAIFILITFSCKTKKSFEKGFETNYRENINKMSKQFDRLGNWEYSPDGKDSLWEKTDASHNLNLVNDVFDSLQPLEKEWDSLMFYAKKYDTIPLPRKRDIELHGQLVNRKVFLIKWKSNLDKSVKLGLYDKNGKLLRDVMSE